jgi:hypothetical protein
MKSKVLTFIQEEIGHEQYFIQERLGSQSEA